MFVNLENKLAYLIKTLAESEVQCDLARRALSENPDFEIKTCFKKLDRQHRGVLTTEDINEFLRENQVFAGEDEALYILDSYDRNQSGRLGLKEFTDLVTPKNYLFISDVQDSKRLSVTFLLKTLLERELSLVRAANPIRATIQDTKGYTPLEFFRFIDRGNRNSISYEDLDLFMQREGSYLSNAEIVAFFKRTDRSNHGRITYVEFKLNVLPNVAPLRGRTISDDKIKLIMSGTTLARRKAEDRFDAAYTRKYTVDPPSKYRSGLVETEPLPGLPESFPTFTKQYFDKYYYYPPVDTSILKILHRPITSSLSHRTSNLLPSNQDYHYPTHEYNPFINYRFPSLSHEYQRGVPRSLSPGRYNPLSAQHYYPYDTRYDYFEPGIKAGLDFSAKRAELMYSTALKESSNLQSMSGILSQRKYESSPLQKAHPSNQVRYSDYLNRYIRSIESNRDFGSTTATIPSELLKNRSPGSDSKVLETAKRTDSPSKQDLSSRLYNIDDIKLKYDRLNSS